MVDLTKEQELRHSGESLPYPEAGQANESPAPRENLETMSWVEKIEKKFARVPNDTSDPADDQVVVNQPQAQQPPVTLPINQQQMMAGKKAKTDLSIAWLVTWVIRKIKMLARLGQRVRFQDLPEMKEGDGRTR